MLLQSPKEHRTTTSSSRRVRRALHVEAALMSVFDRLHTSLTHMGASITILHRSQSRLDYTGAVKNPPRSLGFFLGPAFCGGEKVLPRGYFSALRCRIAKKTMRASNLQME